MTHPTSIPAALSDLDVSWPTVEGEAANAPIDPARIVARIRFDMASLPPDSLYKLTWAQVDALRNSSLHSLTCDSFDEERPSTCECDCNGPEDALALAALIESYLPPR